MPKKKGGSRNNGKTIDKKIKSDVELFNNNRCKQQYTEILNRYTFHDNRQKCIYCGEDIFYDNIVLGGVYSASIQIKKGRSYLSKKEICGNMYSLVVCEDCLIKRFPEWNMLNKNRVFNRPSKYTEYAFNVPHDVMEKKLNELTVRNADSFIKKYGKDEGEIRWQQYRDRQAYTNTFQYKAEKYGMTKDDFDAYNKSRAVTKENLIHRWGKEKGLEKWNNYLRRQSYTTSIEYFIEMYGEIEGMLKWRNFNSSKDFVSKKYSDISQVLFMWLSEHKLFKGHSLYFATKNYEYEIYSKDVGKLYCLDFYDDDLKICIEFNGDKFHPNPNEYKESDIFTNPFGYTDLVKNIWNKEKERYRYLKESKNIDTIVVWESDYRTDPEFVHKSLIEKIELITKNKTYGRS